MKALFIGGIADGQRRQVPAKMPFCKVTKPKDTSIVYINEKDVPTEEELYIRSVLDDGEKQFTVYSLAGLNVVRELINGYRNPLPHEEKLIIG